MSTRNIKVFVLFSLFSFLLGSFFVSSAESNGDTFSRGNVSNLSLSNWEELFPSHSPSPRKGFSLAHNAALDGIVLFGGNGSVGFLDETWLFTENNWQLLSPVHKPRPRTLTAIAFDSNRHMVVMFAGSNHDNPIYELNDTWEFDGSDWIQKFPTSSPINRSGHKMIFRTANNRIYVFGGWGPVGPALNDTWVYDGDNWSQIITTHSPPVRFNFGMAYDSHRDRIVIFGGCAEGWICPSSLGDTWEFDGSDWYQVNTSISPGQRVGNQLVYDPISRKVIMFGGCSLLDVWSWECTGEIFSDVWEFDGTDWTEVQLTEHPSPRYFHGMEFDNTSQRNVMFGGMTSSSVYANDTWVFGERPSTTSPCDGGLGLVGIDFGPGFPSASVTYSRPLYTEKIFYNFWLMGSICPETPISITAGNDPSLTIHSKHGEVIMSERGLFETKIPVSKDGVYNGYSTFPTPPTLSLDYTIEYEVKEYDFALNETSQTKYSYIVKPNVRSLAYLVAVGAIGAVVFVGVPVVVAAKAPALVIAALLVFYTGPTTPKLPEPSNINITSFNHQIEITPPPQMVLNDLETFFGIEFVSLTTVDTLIIDSGEKSPGQNINFSGSNFVPDGHVYILLTSLMDDSINVELEVRTDRNGEIRGQMQIPNNASAGRWLLAAVDAQAMHNTLDDYANDRTTALSYFIAANSISVNNNHQVWLPWIGSNLP